jgi:hypothetical protein
VLPTIVRADEKRLRQILINLLSNALKFTDVGEVIFRVGVAGVNIQPATAPQPLLSPLRIGEGWGGVGGAEGDIFNGTHPPNPSSSPEQFQPGSLRFDIIDTGIGVSADQLERIFLPFEQVGDPQRRAEGTGLGLAITQNLVEAMTGNLQVKSAPGQGSHFSLEVKFPMLWDLVADAAGWKQSWRPHPVAALPPTGLDNNEEDLTPPPPDELAILLDLAMKGEIRALKRRVSHLEQLDDKFKPFARKLSQYVKKYDEVQILALIGRYAS